MAAGLADYARTTAAELDATAGLIGALYRSMNDPELFNALALLYFAAASYSESARRLGRAELASGFLLHNRPGFGDGLRVCLKAGRGPLTAGAKAKLLADILCLIEPVNVAGLANPECRNWYPARAEDLMAAAGRLLTSPAEIRDMLAACGFSLASERK